MARWHDALRTYRRAGLESESRASERKVMFVLCSENHAAAALVAACEPAVVLQVLGGARDPSDPAVRATFEYAILHEGVRQVVVCGHRARGTTSRGELGSRRASQNEVVAQCTRLRSDERIGPLLTKKGVTLRPLWFDVEEGDIFACSIEGDRVALVGDQEFAAMLALSATAPPLTA